jgi:ATP-dependent RNA helicase DDX52/ROK1
LYELLALEGLRVEVVHGNKAMGKRDEAIKGFREGRVWVLVVTEVLARGMDFRGVKVVVNYGESGRQAVPSQAAGWQSARYPGR